jgi:hypothetical protein
MELTLLCLMLEMASNTFLCTFPSPVLTTSHLLHLAWVLHLAWDIQTLQLECPKEKLCSSKNIIFLMAFCIHQRQGTINHSVHMKEVTCFPFKCCRQVPMITSNISVTDWSEPHQTNCYPYFAGATQPNNAPGLFGQGGVQLASGMVCCQFLCII